MFPQTDPLAGVRIKIERAKCHIRELDAEITAFEARRPHEVIANYDAKTRERVLSVRVKEPIPPALSGIAGDIVHNLRVALDQLVWQLVIANRRQPTRRTGFPIKPSATEFKTGGLKEIDGVSRRAYRLIHRLKPYKGGHEFFYLLHELDRLDKHKSIIVVVAAQGLREFGISYPPHLVGKLHADLTFRPTGPLYPLEDGAELYRLSLSTKQPEITGYSKLTIVVAFGKGQVLEGEPILPTLQQMSDLVERVVSIFERRCF